MHGWRLPYLPINPIYTTCLLYFCYRYGSLTWHNGVIPEDEVWIQIGGDKGGKSFQMSFQIVNTSHPNSLQNTVVFVCFEANDSIANLQTVLPPMMDQVSQLAGKKWR